MPTTTTTLNANTKKAGKFIGRHAFVAPVQNVLDINTTINTGLPQLVSGKFWEGLPALEDFKIKPKQDKYEVKIQDGSSDPVITLVGYDITALYSQRDADTENFWLDYNGAEVLLFIEGHLFRRLATPVRQWRLYCGRMLMSDAEINGAEGRPTFVFSAQPNAQDVILTATAVSGKIVFPGLAGDLIPGFTPPSADIKILKHDGVNGCGVVVDA
jgi:hypothetical protein